MKEIHCGCGKLLCRVDENGDVWAWCKSCRKEVRIEVDFGNAKTIKV